MPNDIEQLSSDGIRCLSIDAVQQATSHPGTPMALAPLLYTLRSRTMQIVALLVAHGCAGNAPAAKDPSGVAQAKEAITARFADDGVSPPAVSLASGGQLSFVNGDTQPHQIFSNDCAELTSTVLQPGDRVIARVGTGPKVCHYQDLLAPKASQYWGTVGVAEPPSSLSDFWFNPGDSR